MRRPGPWRRVRDRLERLLGRSTGTDGESWSVSRSEPTATRWRRGDETLDCLALGDGYVATTGRAGVGNRWQLTPGGSRLPVALAVATLYLDHGTTPQFDRDGRPFVGVADGRPRQVFERTTAGAGETEYVYLDAVGSLAEFPDFLRVRPDVERARDRMDGRRPRSVRRD